MQRVVHREFKNNSKETDSTRIEYLKSNAIRGLANYLMMESTAKDARFRQSTQNYANKAAASLKLENPAKDEI